LVFYKKSYFFKKWDFFYISLTIMLGLAEPIAKISIPPRLGKLLTRSTVANERTIPQNKVQPSLGYLVDRAAAKKQRLSLTYQNQAFVAIVPIEDDERFE
jgi:hypothetical protein